MSSEVKRYLQTKMRMSRIYQPVMIRELIKLGGAASVEEIAKALLSYAPRRSSTTQDELLAPSVTEVMDGMSMQYAVRLDLDKGTLDSAHKTLCDKIFSDKPSISDQQIRTSRHDGKRPV